MISDEKLLTVAIEYYLQKKTQTEIADELNVSHVQVGNYLKEAMRRNIVSIHVNLPVSESEEENLRQLFKDIFHLKNLVVVQGSENSDKSQVLVVQRAVEYILEKIPDNKLRIGVGWGKTIHDISVTRNPGQLKEKWEYCPVCMLEKREVNPYFDSVRLVRNLEKNWGGKVDAMLVDTMCLNQKLPNEEFQKRMSESWKTLNMLVCGLGCTWTRCPLPQKEMFSEKVCEEINMKSLVGDIIHNFYDIDGNMYTVKDNEDLIPIEDIRNIPRVIAVASGFPKVESIIGGLRTGLVDTLITDVQTARHVIEYLK